MSAIKENKKDRFGQDRGFYSKDPYQAGTLPARCPIALTSCSTGFMAGRLSESEVAVLKLEIGNYNTRCDRTSDERVNVIMTAPAYRKRPQSRSFLVS